MKAWRKTVRTGLFGAGVGVAATAGVVGWMRTGQTERPSEPLTTVLARVQALGELRTVRFTYENVSDVATARPVADWAAPIPGAASLVAGLTRNEGLVSVRGTVDAGVDLREAAARFEGEGDGRRIVVEVPAPQVFPPRVEAQVHHARRGLLWDDANLGLTAERRAAEGFRQASLRQGILDRARAETRERLAALLDPVADVPVEVRFVDEHRRLVSAAHPLRTAIVER